MKHTPLTPEQAQEAAARYAAGEAFNALLRCYHVDHYTLKRAFTNLGVTMRKAGEALQAKLTERDVDEMVAEYARAPDMERLAALYKTSHRKIRGYLSSRGVQLLRRGQYPNRKLRPHTKNEAGEITHIGCSACKRLLPVSDFQKLKHGLAHTQNMCRECKIAARKSRLYGVDCERYVAMLEAQQHKCAICGGRGSADRPHSPLMIDHDHETGRVRMLLCHGCNSMLGHAGDNPAILDAGRDYLRAHGKQLK
jgi:hypothetical protein